MAAVNPLLTALFGLACFLAGAAVVLAFWLRYRAPVLVMSPQPAEPAERLPVPDPLLEVEVLSRKLAADRGYPQAAPYLAAALRKVANGRPR